MDKLHSGVTNIALATRVFYYLIKAFYNKPMTIKNTETCVESNNVPSTQKSHEWMTHVKTQDGKPLTLEYFETLDWSKGVHLDFTEVPESESKFVHKACSEFIREWPKPPLPDYYSIAHVMKSFPGMTHEGAQAYIKFHFWFEQNGEQILRKAYRLHGTIMAEPIADFIKFFNTVDPNHIWGIDDW